MHSKSHASFESLIGVKCIMIHMHVGSIRKRRILYNFINTLIMALDRVYFGLSQGVHVTLLPCTHAHAYRMACRS